MKVFERPRFLLVSLMLLLALVPAWANDVPAGEEPLLSNVRQLTFEGARAGEGYFSADGARMIFQSEREPGNPFYQIYALDLETGDVTRVSPGYGKTTCAWIHPNGTRAMFASTHDDPDARKKMEAELEFRASGQTRRYSWDYDEHYELYEAALDGTNVKRLTNTLGYDAEGSYSPDGTQIVFASNRNAYARTLSEEDAKAFDHDPAYMMDIYIMDANGANVRQLTDTRGYDGGPFFSPNGDRITWRRFAPNGATAEIYTMYTDGTDQRQITNLGVMSWAPFYHPSGDYLIFTTNKHGFDNFELYIVDAWGKGDPVRVTHTPGFDGLPVFTPDGAGLAWTTNRTSNGSSQIFMASWDDAKARALLGLNPPLPDVTLENAPDISATTPAITEDDLRLHIEYLASDELQGRGTGTIGELKSTTYLAGALESFGLHPAGDDGTYFQQFEFTAGVSLDSGNELRLLTTAHPIEFTVGQDWRPLAYSRTGFIEEAGVVFAGYGIRAPQRDGFDEYDSFVHLDVTDKWVIVFRYMPENIDPELRQHLNTHSSLRYKAMTVRDLGAKGLIVVSGPNSQVEGELVQLTFDASLGGTSVAAISVTDSFAQRLLDFASRDLKTLQDSLDTGALAMGFPIPGVTLEANIDIKTEKRWGRNVLARLYAGDQPGERAVVVGAHADHLGIGKGSTSLARAGEEDAIHYGADDNASGVAAALEIAQYLAHQKEQGALGMQHDLLIALWSGEELGLLGSKHFTETYAGKDSGEPLTPEISAYLNMDMIGRLEDNLVLHGVGTSAIWPAEVERRNAPVGLPISLQNESYIPTDATSFVLKEVPFLSAFTGAHEDYHTPRDTPEKINYEGAQKIARFMALVTRSLLTSDTAPEFVEPARPENMGTRANLRAYLGTIPDYAGSDVPGLKISGVTTGSPADEAGLKPGDLIVELAGRTIENIYDYTFAIEALKIGEEVTIVVLRNGERLSLPVTPGSRE